jgi:MFS family permease
MNLWRGLKDLPKNMWLLFATTLINRCGTMVMPFLALYLTKIKHTSPGEAGFVLAFYGIGSLVTSPFVGKLSDKVGKLLIMELSLILSGVVLFFYPLLNDITPIIILTFIWAIISEAFRPVNLSIISEIVTPEQRRPAFALNRLAINLGMSVGPVIGGLLILINFHMIFYINGLSSIIAGIYLIRANKKFYESVPVGKENNDFPLESKSTGMINFSSLFKDKHLYYFLLSLLPVQIVFFQTIAAMPLFIVKNLGLSEAVFGLLMAINTVMIIFIEVPLNNAIINWTHSKALSVGAVLCAVGFGGLVFTSNIYALVITIITWTFGEMIFFPSSAAYMAEISPPEKSGEYMGYYQMIFSFSFAFGPWLGAVVFQNYGAPVLWTLTFVFGIISTFMMLRVKNK